MNDYTSHVYFDEYWRSKIPALERITCPTYIISSWGDHGIHTRGTLNAYYKIPAKEKYLEIYQYQKYVLFDHIPLRLWFHRLTRLQMGVVSYRGVTEASTGLPRYFPAGQADRGSILASGQVRHA